jgi:hypothetical protein
MDSEVEAAFKTLKEALCAAFAYLHPIERFLIDTDASKVGIRGVLSQMQVGRE